MKSLEEKIITFDNGNMWNGPVSDWRRNRSPKEKVDLEILKEKGGSKLDSY